MRVYSLTGKAHSFLGIVQHRKRILLAKNVLGNFLQRICMDVASLGYLNFRTKHSLKCRSGRLRGAWLQHCAWSASWGRTAVPGTKTSQAPSLPARSLVMLWSQSWGLCLEKVKKKKSGSKSWEAQSADLHALVGAGRFCQKGLSLKGSAQTSQELISMIA